MQNAKMLRVEWDGRDGKGQTLPDGIYTFKVRAINEAGESVAVTPLMSGQVSGIIYENNEALLSLHGELISPNAIFSASLP
jgi:flagellar basal-body rod modification protein FlgD